MGKKKVNKKPSKKTVSIKKTNTKPNGSKLSKEVQSLLTLSILFILSIISLLRMGLIGEVLDNLNKYIFGSFGYIIYIMLLIVPVFVIFKKKVENIGIMSIFFIMLMLIFEMIFFKSEAYTIFSYSFVSDNNSSFLGGGIISRYIVQFLVYLLSYYGSLIIIISFAIVIVLIFINKNYPGKINLLLFKIKKIIYSEDDSSSLNKKINNSNEVIKENKLIEENTTEQYYNDLKEQDLIVDMNSFEKSNNNYEEKLERNRNRAANIENNKTEKSEEHDYSQETVNYDNYLLPPLTLLKDPVENKKISKEDIVNKSKILQSTFQNFGIEVKIVKAIVGPSITQFQILPTPGTKVSKIVNLSSDIALNLAAKDIRIEAPIPGKSLIGIEIPNSVNQLVTMKEVFVNDKDDSPLSVALGKDVSGESIFARLDKMPHLLVAGSTGSGKSVCVNTIITSLLMKNKPDKVKLIMIDPKMVELSIYDGIPHLLTPVVTNPTKAADVLHKVVLEMEKRYREFSIARVKNIEGYNKIAKEDPDYKELPYIIVIIDELADLMMVASKEVEESIARISQMARAAGIHLIIATQRPSVDVITGVIKTNIPSRIAFAVSSSVDSRTIIDKTGAEALLGKGDMLFQSAESSKPVRLQGAFLSDQEVENIVDFIKGQSDTEYDPNMLPSENLSKDGSNSDSDVDPLYREVLLFIAKTQKASASLLQRRFKIGYNRAARIIEMLEDDGYISAQDGSKPRKVFLEPEYAENNK